MTERTATSAKEVGNEISEIFSTQSELAAYLLGAFSAAGSIGKDKVVLGSTDPNIPIHIRNIAQQVLPIKGSIYEYPQNNPNGKPIYQLNFSSRHFANSLRPANGRSRIGTILESYPWVKEENYIWQFLGGYFDLGGRFADLSKGPAIVFLRAINSETRIIIVDLLELAGFKFNSKKAEEAREPRDEVCIYGRNQILTFTDKVLCRVPEKKLAVKKYRDKVRVLINEARKTKHQKSDIKRLISLYNEMGLSTQNPANKPIVEKFIFNLSGEIEHSEPQTLILNIVRVIYAINEAERRSNSLKNSSMDLNEIWVLDDVITALKCSKSLDEIQRNLGKLDLAYDKLSKVLTRTSIRIRPDEEHWPY